MIFIPIVGLLALALAVVARWIMPDRHARQIKLAETRQTLDWTYQQSEALAQEFATIQREANHFESQLAELEQAVKSLEKLLDSALAKPPVLLRDLVADGASTPLQYVALISRNINTGHRGIWAYRNHLLVYADSPQQAATAAAKAFPQASGYQISFKSAEGTPTGQIPPTLATAAKG